MEVRIVIKNGRKSLKTESGGQIRMLLKIKYKFPLAPEREESLRIPQGCSLSLLTAHSAQPNRNWRWY